MQYLHALLYSWSTGLVEAETRRVQRTRRCSRPGREQAVMAGWSMGLEREMGLVVRWCGGAVVWRWIGAWFTGCFHSGLHYCRSGTAACDGCVFECRALSLSSPISHRQESSCIFISSPELLLKTGERNTLNRHLQKTSLVKSHFSFLLPLTLINSTIAKHLMALNTTVV